MKKLWTVFAAFVAFCLHTDAEAKPQDSNQVDYATGRNLYSARYDNLNIGTILNSPRLVTNYVECLLNKKPCPPEGKELKHIMPEALRTKCSKCSNRQKEGALQVIRKLYFDYPNHYSALREKWDPTGEYHRRFLEYLQEEQFNQIDNHQSDNDKRVPAPSPSAVVPVTRVALPPTTTQRVTTTTSTTPRPPPPPPPPTTTTVRTTVRTTTPRPPPPPPTTRRADSTTRATRSPALTNVPAIDNSVPALPAPAVLSSEIEVVRATEVIVPQASNTPTFNTVRSPPSFNSFAVPETTVTQSVSAWQNSNPDAGARTSTASSLLTSAKALPALPPPTFPSTSFTPSTSTKIVTTIPNSVPAPSTKPLTTTTTTRAVLPEVTTETRPQASQSVGNRFGNDEAAPSTRRPQRPTAAAYLPPQTSRPFQPFNNLINNFFVPPNQQNQAQQTGPIAGFINEFGKKVSKTTEAIVGMLHNTARIFTGAAQPPNFVN